jgi:hypothetical protein
MSRVFIVCGKKHASRVTISFSGSHGEREDLARIWGDELCFAYLIMPIAWKNACLDRFKCGRFKYT